jgi:hypothetical protein
VISTVALGGENQPFNKMWTSPDFYVSPKLFNEFISPHCKSFIDLLKNLNKLQDFLSQLSAANHISIFMVFSSTSEFTILR